jgi:hypothetical protein
MPAFGVLLLLVQVGFAVHAVRTGRAYWWIGIIMFVPAAGCIAYLVAEVLPELSRSRAARQAVQDVRTLIDPERGYREAVNRFAETDTVETRAQLAGECVNLKRYQEAIDLYRGALIGHYAHDPHLMLRLAEAQFLNGAPEGAVETLEQLRAHNPGFDSTDGHLLYARSLEAAQRMADALREYAALAVYYPGEEARARHALLLIRTGEVDLAREVFRDLIRKVDRAPRHYARAEREWYNLAKQHVPG